jgi:hypothetical protein
MLHNIYTLLEFETDSKEVPWGKTEKNFEKRVKSTWNDMNENFLVGI